MRIGRRGFQETAVEQLQKLLPEHGRVLAVGPTGCGKTVVFAKLIKAAKRYRRVLFLAHTYEIIDQTFKRLVDVGIHPGIIMASEEVRNGDERVSHTARVQVASVPTVVRRGVPYAPDLIVFDEAHRSPSDSYQNIAARYPDAHVLGLTATPDRLDGKGLADFYQHMYTIAEPSDLYRLGYLAKPKVYGAPIDANSEIIKALAKVRTRGGDYAQEEAGLALSTKKLIGHVVKEAKRLAPGVPKVCFASTVKQAEKLAQRFNRAGIKAVCIHGGTPADERDKALADLRAGRIEVVCNVDVLGEGWDMPELACVIIARPTKSRVRMWQMCGRVQRPFPGKTPIIIDHGRNVLRLGMLPGTDYRWSLKGAEDGEVGEAPQIIRQCEECLTAFEGPGRECPNCGAVAALTRQEIKAEEDARLVEYRSESLSALSVVIAGIASRRGAPGGWSDRLARAMVRGT